MTKKQDTYIEEGAKEFKDKFTCPDSRTKGICYRVDNATPAVEWLKKELKKAISHGRKLEREMILTHLTEWDEHSLTNAEFGKNTRNYLLNLIKERK